MYTTYDEIYSTFMDNNLADDIDLPQTELAIFRVINNAVKLYNNEERRQVECIDSQQTVNTELNNDEVLIIAHFIRLVFLKNQLSAFSLTWQPFDKDMGLKNYSSQNVALNKLVNECKDTIQRLIHNKEEDIF